MKILVASARGLGSSRVGLFACLSALLITSGVGARQASPQAVADLVNKGDELRVKREKDPLDQSIEQYRRALEMTSRDPSSAVQARARLGIGISLGLRGLNTEAAPYLRQAVTDFEALADRPHQAEALIELGNALPRVTDAESGIPFVRQGIDLARAAHDRRLEALGLIDLAGLLNNSTYGFASSNAVSERRALVDQAVAIERERGDRVALADALNARGFLGGEDRPDSLRDEGEALDLATAANDPRAMGFCLTLLAWARSADRSNTELMNGLRQSLALVRRAGDRVQEVETASGLARTLREIGRFREALALYQQSLAVSREIKDRTTEGWLLEAVGVTMADLGQKREGLGLVRESLEIVRATHNRLEETTTLIAIASAMLDQSDNTGAMETAHQALELALDIKDVNRQVVAYDYIGLARGALGQYTEALEAFNQALDLARQSHNLPAEVAINRYVGQVYSLLGDRGRALEYYETALSDARQTKDALEQAVNMSFAAGIRAEDGDFSKADPQLAQALSIARDTGLPTMEARVYSVMAKVAALRRDTRAEIRYQSDTVAALRRSEDSRGLATSLAQLGEAYLRQGDRARALDYLLQGLSSSKETKDPVAEGLALTGLMRYWRAGRQTDAAVFFGKQAVAQFQETRSNLIRLDPAVQRAYVQSRAQVYRELADLLITQGRLLEAEQVLDLIKQQEFLDFVRRGVAETSDDKKSADYTASETASLERYQAIADRIVEIGARHRELLAIKNPTPEEKSALAAADADLTAANLAFSKALEVIVAEFDRSAAARAQVSSIKEDRSLMTDLRTMGPGTVVAYTLLTPTQYHVLLMTSEVRKVVTVNIDPAELHRRIFAMREALQTPTRDPRGPAKAVYDIVMAPIAHDLEQAHVKTILWSLDRALRYVPMAALYDGHRYVAESYQNAVITPASRSHIVDNSQGVHWTGLGVGVSRELSGFAGLPAVAAELHSIFRESPESQLGVLSGRVLLDAAFTADAFRGSLRERAPVVHIASHFQLRPGHDQDSFLLLGDGTHMTLADFDNAPNMFENVDLLTLSACNTAVGTDAEGDEIESFGVIAQQLGAKTVIASLWPVADDSTRTLMERFYRTRVDSGVSKAEALRQAQIALLHGSPVGSGGATPVASQAQTAPQPRGVQLPGNTASLPLFTAPAGAPWSHPYYWAPFILIGNAR